MKRVIWWFVVIGLLAAAAYGGWRWYQKSQQAGPVNYHTAVVKKTDLVSTISATGTVVPEDVVDVGTQVNGQIASFGTDTDGKPVDYRSVVQEGMVLARIDDTLYAADVASGEAQLAQAQASVRVAEANRAQAQAKLDQSQRDWDRAQKLGQSRALSQADYDASKSAFEQAQASLTLAEATIVQAQASVAMAQASLQRSRRNLTFCIIPSPVSGVIIDRRVDIGQTVVSSLNAPSLFLIARDLKRMQVLVQVNEADIGHVAPGAKVTFGVEAFPGEQFSGEVRKVRLNATMTQNVVTYTVEIVTDNSSMRLLPYLTANVRFLIDSREQALVVPNAALRWSPSETAAPPAPVSPGSPGQPGAARSGQAAPAPGAERAGRQGGGRQRPAQEGDAPKEGARRAAPANERTVWVMTDSGLRPVAVQAGLSDGTLTEIVSGDLKEGDAVVVGEETGSTGAAAAGASTNPFAPQIMRGGRGGGGGGGGGGGRGR